MARILVVDDEPKMTALVCGELEDAGHRVSTATDPQVAMKMLETHSYDVVVTDLSMPNVSGMTILDKALERTGTEVIIMTAYGTVESAVKAMKRGAADYLIKPFSLEELALLVNRLISQQRQAAMVEHLEKQAEASLLSEFVGRSAAAEKVKKLIHQVAPTDASVLITGKSGTGKELVARMIHQHSRRKENAFIAINCAALTETLLESELFGHEKGAFTGAQARKRGRFELAEKGTIFLDEIGEMSPGMQSKLLRVIEERQLVRVGGIDSVDIDVRIISATNRNLKDEIKRGGFREDLYFRLNVFPIAIPTLAERVNDVVALAEHMLQRQGFAHWQLAEPVTELLTAYDWPGNIRELRNVLERAAILSGGEPLSVEDFSLEIDDAPLDLDDAPMGERGLEATEKQLILGALERAGGNKTEAAKLLRITRRRLYSRMKVHDIKG